MLMPVSNISPSQTHHQCSDDTSTSGAYRMAWASSCARTLRRVREHRRRTTRSHSVLDESSILCFNYFEYPPLIEITQGDPFPSFSHLLCFVAIGEQIKNSISEGRHVAERNHEAIVFVLNCFTASTYICHNAGNSYG